jgi:hypothetical protein
VAGNAPRRTALPKASLPKLPPVPKLLPKPPLLPQPPLCVLAPRPLVVQVALPLLRAPRLPSPHWAQVCGLVMGVCSVGGALVC